eukprot:scaffold1525_cov142-Cylindrotheca_fusiformis.AAC.146
MSGHRRLVDFCLRAYNLLVKSEAKLTSESSCRSFVQGPALSKRLKLSKRDQWLQRLRECFAICQLLSEMAFSTVRQKRIQPWKEKQSWCARADPLLVVV